MHYPFNFYPLYVYILILFLFFLSLISITIFVEKLRYFHSQKCNAPLLFHSLKKYLEISDYAEAIKFLETNNTLVARVLKEGVYRIHHKNEATRLMQSMQLQEKLELVQLEKNATILSLIAYIAPLIGLLGTVISFIELLQRMQQLGHFDALQPNSLAALEAAFVTTCCAMTLSIPSYIAYNMIVRKVEGFLLQMNIAKEHLIQFTEEHDLG